FRADHGLDHTAGLGHGSHVAPGYAHAFLVIGTLPRMRRTEPLPSGHSGANQSQHYDTRDDPSHSAHLLSTTRVSRMQVSEDLLKCNEMLRPGLSGSGRAVMASTRPVTPSLIPAR